MHHTPTHTRAGDTAQQFLSLGPYLCLVGQADLYTGDKNKCYMTVVICVKHEMGPEQNGR